METEGTRQTLSYRNKVLYSALPDSGVIRLVRILPGHWEKDIVCDIFETPLATTTPYKALSYAWELDQPTPNVKICCNGVDVEVGANLFHALRRLRHVQVPFVIWIDFLCINQQDVKERSLQVAMMREIYEQSCEVIIWLGEHNKKDHLQEGQRPAQATGEACLIEWYDDKRDLPKVDLHYEIFHKLRPDETEDVFGAFCVIYLLSQGEAPANIPALVHAFHRSNTESGFRALMSRSWWERIWVVQETVLARKATIRFSNILAPYTMFSHAAVNYSRSRLEDNVFAISAHDVQDSLENFQRITNSIDATRQDWLKDQPIMLLSLLRRFRSRKASDERDKAFALLNLVRQWGPNGSLRADYCLQPDEVWFQITKDIIRSSGCLDILAGTLRGTGASNEYPSWIADWSASPQPLEFERLSRITFYNASSRLPGLVRLHGRSILEVQGICVDKIKWYGNTPVEGTHDGMRDAASHWRQGLERHITGEYISGGSPLNAFWKTLCADILYWTRKEPGKAFRPTDAGFQSYLNWYNWDENIMLRMTIRDGFWQPGPEFRESRGDSNAFHYAVECASRGRRFFITSKGYIGIGPSSLKEGDEVFVLLGSKVPLLLRRAKKPSICHNEMVETLVSTEHETEKETRCSSNHQTFELVGDAYVHGIMDDQTATQQNPLLETVFLA